MEEPAVIEATGAAAGAAVLSVREGPPAADGRQRTFSVMLTATIEGDDWSIVATAADPGGGPAIPAAGSRHPRRAGLVAGEPVIYAVGLKRKDGPWLATRSRLFNVRVRYMEATTP